MKRRDFVQTGTLAAIVGAVGEQVWLEAAQRAAARTAPARGPLHKLTAKEDPQRVQAEYENRSLVERSAREASGSSVPYVYAYYDEAARTFVNPLTITPTLKAAPYTLEAMLHAFNIRKADQTRFTNLKDQVQLGFNATAPITTSEQLTWLFMNAVDIFLAKEKDRPDQLTKFQSNAGPGTVLHADPKITVAKGTVELQVTAFGQRRDGFWRKFIDVVTAAAGSPIISQVSKGFGIPSLALDALKFVDHVVDVFTEQEKLVPLWSTGSLEFAVHQGATARFKMKPGLWVIVDTEYAQRSNFLAGHNVDLQFQSFRLTDRQNQPVDANYLVTDLKLTA